MLKILFLCQVLNIVILISFENDLTLLLKIFTFLLYFLIVVIGFSNQLIHINECMTIKFKKTLKLFNALDR